MKHIKEFSLSESQDSDSPHCLNPKSTNPKIYYFWPGQFQDLRNFLDEHTGGKSFQSWDESRYEWAFDSIVNTDDKVILIMDDPSGLGWVSGLYLIDEDSVLGAKNIYGERRFSYGHKIEQVLEKDSLKGIIRKMMDFRKKVI